jgi:hypothetical protein
VDSTQVAVHEALGWRLAPVATLVEDQLLLDGSVVKPSAAALNALALPSLAAGTLENMPFRHYQSAPAAISATYVHAAVTLTTAVLTVTTDITNPDVPRTVTAKGNASGIAGNVIVTGTNMEGEKITDTIALSGTAEVEGVKAFKTITAIQLPIKTNTSGDTVSIGIASKIGLPHIVSYAVCLLLALFGGAADTGGTLAVDADEIEKNLYTPAGTLDGSTLLDLYYLATSS